MTTKCKYIMLFISTLLFFYSCVLQKNVQQDSLKDIYGNPISYLIESRKTIYFFENGKKVIAYLGGVEFNGGQDSLSTYLLTKYVNHPDYNYNEYNMIEYFFILFDRNLEIKEVRIMKKKQDEKRFYYDNIFIDAFKSTNGMWHKTVEGKRWYIYMHQIRVY